MCIIMAYLEILFVTGALPSEMSICIFRMIHLWYKRVAIALACWNFLLFLTIEKSNGIMVNCCVSSQMSIVLVMINC